ncbi:hypothetical protein T4D_7191 [Trichinella pseudospiralis]|uniref:Uncharacterized protein n=1 Tax=Trichinella pseudospiralis TaxID=6337 RepID=A0A0V1FRI7_TRIPS|nr:hypothetical protein T4D_7191 [Trichinella pseudospiralis]
MVWKFFFSSLNQLQLILPETNGTCISSAVLQNVFSDGTQWYPLNNKIPKNCSMAPPSTTKFPPFISHGHFSIVLHAFFRE